MKYSSLFITATNTNVGKTYTTLKLIDYFQSKGLKVGVLKPIETGVIDVAEDAIKLFNAAIKNHPALESLGIDYIVPYKFTLPAAPFVARVDVKISKSLILKHFEEIEKISDIVLVEGAGGLMVPIEKDFYMIDLMEYLKLKVILVTSSKLGSINDTLLSMNALNDRDIDFDWLVNIYEDAESFETVTAPFYEKTFGGYLTIKSYLHKN